jgi:signal transduction histidine kinase
MMRGADKLRSASSWLWRPTLSRRIAIAMVLSVVAIQAQALLQIRLFSNPEFRLTGTRWLAEATNRAVTAALAVPAEQRTAVLRKISEDSQLRLTWRPTLPMLEPDDGATPHAARLAATLREVLSDKAQAIHINATSVNYRFGPSAVHVTITPEGVLSRLGDQPVRADEPDVLIPAGTRIWVQTGDGSWVGVEPVGFRDGAFSTPLPYTPLLAAGIIIALVSTLLARRLMAPLDRLVAAAERIGTAREPVKVDTAGLHEFAAVARAFEDMQSRLLRFVDDRTRMLAAISHDLRTSLTRLRLAAESCQGDAERAALWSEIDEMQSMVESTLTFASGEARLAPHQPTDIAALLISLVDEASDAGRPSTYAGPDHIEAMGQPIALKRAFWNVIDNALKYGKCARVSVGIVTGAVTVRISDDGPGIPELRQEEAFAPFRRLDPARSHEIPGVGLGLTITRDVVQGHGGSIDLSNGPHGGLTVTMMLPRR